MAQFVAPKMDGSGNFVNSKPLRKVVLPSEEVKKTKGLPPGYCVICNRDFGSKGFLVKHFKETHKDLVPVEEDKKKDDSVGTGNAS